MTIQNKTGFKNINSNNKKVCLDEDTKAKAEIEITILLKTFKHYFYPKIKKRKQLA